LSSDSGQPAQTRPQGLTTMASLSRTKRCNRQECKRLKRCPHGGGFRILFVRPDGSRPTLYLGKVPKQTAIDVKRHVENILSAKATGTVLATATATWLTEIDKTLRSKLAQLGLTTTRDVASTLAPFIDGYIARRTDAKPRTRQSMEGARN